MVILWSESWEMEYVSGARGLEVSDPALAQATGDTFFRRPPRHCSYPPSAILYALPNWQWVVPTLHFLLTRNVAPGSWS